MQLKNQPSALLAILGLLMLVCGRLGGQEISPEQGPVPMPAVRELTLEIPPGVEPRVTKGETLLLTTAPGKSQVVRSYCELGDHLLVMLPTGALEIVKRSATQPTNKPFATSTSAEMEAALKSAGFAKYKYADAKPYFFAYACSEAFYLHTRSILQSMLPGVLARLREWGLEATDPSLPLVVIIMSSRAEFEAYEKVPPEMIAFYDKLKNYVVLYEDQKLAEAAPELAAKQAAYTVAHESIHQLLANTNVERRLANWPMWIREGLPEYFSPLKFNSKLVSIGGSQLPERTIKWTKPGMVNDIRMYDLLQMQGGDGEVTKKLIQSSTLDTKGYALAWGLVHYLASKDREKFQAYLKDISQLKPFDRATIQLAGRPDPHFATHFGHNFKTLEQGVLQHLNSRQIRAEYKDPVENQTHYLVRCTQKVGRAVHFAALVVTSPAEARRWKETQQKQFKRARVVTEIYPTRGKALFQLEKLR
jgi:hypothetical protein